ncbi:proline racemase [Streptomyces sulfonofaciens]|uniref:Proline racemase n=1 Tax=Streptomyces sulfonofaciens TaxID=68272 RepID=A0A919GLK2_9ACTN|nr:proline racemase [Streptomyces sulfonofaciens]
MDYHTAGEPFRIVTEGVPDIAGASVLERREYARTTPEVDAVRRLLVNEPRGHADMYGCFLVPPDDEGADFGVLFWHKDGYSTACGHGTIALGAFAVHSGLVAADPDGDTDIRIDVPSGRVTARVTCAAGRVVTVAFRNVPAHVVARDVELDTTRGPIRADLSWGGALYACVAASSVGLAVSPERYTELVAFGREVKWALNGTAWARHPHDPRLDGVYGTVLYDDLGTTPEGVRQRNITVFADGEADRSPCGSGTSARLALLVGDGTLPVGRTLRHESIVGTAFEGRVLSTAGDGDRDTVVTEVRGNAYRTGTAVFTLDPYDDLATGFVLR